MPFATVKSSKYGEVPKAKAAHLWSEAHWRQLIIAAIIALPLIERQKWGPMLINRYLTRKMLRF